MQRRVYILFLITGILILLSLAVKDLKKEKPRVLYKPLICDHFIVANNVTLLCSDGHKYNRI
jgi:hypothetical protein